MVETITEASGSNADRERPASVRGECQAVTWVPERGSVLSTVVISLSMCSMSAGVPPPSALTCEVIFDGETTSVSHCSCTGIDWASFISSRNAWSRNGSMLAPVRPAPSCLDS